MAFKIFLFALSLLVGLIINGANHDDNLCSLFLSLLFRVATTHNLQSQHTLHPSTSTILSIYQMLSKILESPKLPI